MRIREKKSRAARIPLLFALSLQILYFSGLTKRVELPPGATTAVAFGRSAPRSRSR